MSVCVLACAGLTPCFGPLMTFECPKIILFNAHMCLSCDEQQRLLFFVFSLLEGSVR